jgi:hypothetical protein
MAPRVTPIVTETAQQLQVWLEGVQTEQDAAHILYLWAKEHGARKVSHGISGKVYLTTDVVVKMNYLVESSEGIPPQYLPEEVVVWADQWSRLVVQPRYEEVADQFQNAIGDRLERLRNALPNWRGIASDGHINNWGLRPDGSPVLFDW